VNKLFIVVLVYIYIQIYETTPTAKPSCRHTQAFNNMALINRTLHNSCSISYLTFPKPLKPISPKLLQCRIIFPRYNATTTNVNVSERKSANYQPNLWTYDFLQSLKHAYAVIHSTIIIIIHTLQILNFFLLTRVYVICSLYNVFRIQDMRTGSKYCRRK